MKKLFAFVVIAIIFLSINLLRKNETTVKSISEEETEVVINSASEKSSEASIDKKIRIEPENNITKKNLDEDKSKPQEYDFFKEQVALILEGVEKKNPCLLVKLNYNKEDFSRLNNHPDIVILINKRLNLTSSEKEFLTEIKKENPEVSKLEKLALEGEILSVSYLSYLFLGLERKNKETGIDLIKASKMLNFWPTENKKAAYWLLKTIFNIKSKMSNKVIWKSLVNYLHQTDYRSPESIFIKRNILETSNDPALFLVSFHYLLQTYLPDLGIMKGIVYEYLDNSDLVAHKSLLRGTLKEADSSIKASFKNEFYLPWVTDDTNTVGLKRLICRRVYSLLDIKGECGVNYNSSNYKAFNSFVKKLVEVEDKDLCSSSSYRDEFTKLKRF